MPIDQLPATLILPSFGMSGYCSWGSPGFFISAPTRITTFIGPNNAGKSNIIKALCLMRAVLGVDSGQIAIPETERRAGEMPMLSVNVPLEQLIAQVEYRQRFVQKHQTEFATCIWNLTTGGIEIPQLDSLFQNHELGLIQFHLNREAGKAGADYEQFLRATGGVVRARCRTLLSALKRVVSIPPVREIRGAQSGSLAAGNGLVELLKPMQIPNLGQESERAKFDDIQNFVRNLLGEPSLILEIPQPSPDIIIRLPNRRLPLKSFGSGIEQLVVLAATIAINRNTLICIEEPEAHLHPSLLRRFAYFLREHKYNGYFITTHSNVLLDSDLSSTIYEVGHNGTRSTLAKVSTPTHGRAVLDALDCRASDILQANGVIWVEGPSDRVYLRQWMQLIRPGFIEGADYSFAYYGGAVLSHYTAEDDSQSDLLEVLNINRNCFVVMDRDTSPPNVTKERIKQELGEPLCWITAGREIENYVSNRVWNEFLRTDCQRSYTVNLESGDDIQLVIGSAAHAAGQDPVPYDKKKPYYSAKVASQMSAADLDVLDLRARVKQLCDLVEKWAPRIAPRQ